MTVETRPVFEPYLPRLLVEWSAGHPDERFRVVPGSLVSLDISGFTSLSERLQAKGRAGAEELILLIGGVFEGLIGIAHRHGGDVLKFRGDALLLLFPGEGHELRACRAAADMQWLIEQTGETMSSVGPVQLRMATGIYSGECHFYLVGSTHRELVVTGPAASETVKLESTAQAGEILVSPATAAALDPDVVAADRDGARLLRLEPDPSGAPEASVIPASSAGDGLEQFVPAPLRAHLALEAGEGEHRQVTAAFVKFSGTDDSLLHDGPEAVLEQLEALGEIVGDTAGEFGVTWLESDVDVNGGKVYLVAGAPSSAGSDEERMLRALRRIVDAGRGPAVRAGVNRGPAFAGDIGASSRRTYAVMGDTVNLAARLTARAEPGQILASADVLDRSRTLFETSHQPFLMKGKERPVTAYSVGEPVGVREEGVDRTLLLIGRERELEVLREALDAARMRQPRLVELVGEPGIGKSRLVEELKTLAVGLQQLVTRSEAYELSTPFFAFRSLLRPLAGITPEQSAAEAGAQLAPWVQAVMPDLAPWLPLLAVPFDAEVPSTPETDAIDPQFRRDKLHEVIEQFMTRMLLVPTLFVFEDTHWMDDASSFLLRHLMASPLPRPWLVVVTRRPEGQPFTTTESGATISLEPLPEDATTQLALAAADETALSALELGALTERAGGNPLFVRELVAVLRETRSLDALPETVETLMTARIDRLDPGDRLLLRYASVVGPTFDLDLMREILAGQAVDLERWQRLSEFVEWETGETLRFRHDLFRAMAYEGLSFRRRREIHGKVGEALERRAQEAVDEVAGLLSVHFLEAGDHRKAWRYAVAAGRAAQASFANVVAAELYERALRAAAQLPELSGEEVRAVWESLGDVATLFAEYQRAADAFREAMALAADDTVARTALMRKVGVSIERLGNREEAVGWFDRALAELDAGDFGTAGLLARAQLEIAYAGNLYYQSRFDDCISWAERAARDAEEAGDRSALAHAYYILSLAAAQAGHPDPRYHERAIEIYEETGELLGYGVLLNNLGIQAYEEYRWDEALDLYRRAAELSGRAGDVTSVARVHVNEAEILAEQGRLDEAEELLGEVMRVWRAAGYRLFAAATESNLGRVIGRAGRFEEAKELLERARTTFAELDNPLFVLEATARIAEVHVLAGEHREALTRARAALEEADRAGAPRALYALIERLIGYALVQGRRKEEARPYFERSLAVAREARAELEIAVTLKATADTGVAGRDAAEEAQAILDRLGVVSVPRVPLP